MKPVNFVPRKCPKMVSLGIIKVVSKNEKSNFTFRTYSRPLLGATIASNLVVSFEKQNNCWKLQVYLIMYELSHWRVGIKDLSHFQDSFYWEQEGG